MRRSLRPDAPDLQRKGDVVGNAHQRKESKVLEDQRCRALVRADALHVLPADQHPAFGRIGEAGNTPQQGGLAAAGWPQEGEELAALDDEMCIVDRGIGPKTDGNVIQNNIFCGHGALSRTAGKGDGKKGGLAPDALRPAPAIEKAGEALSGQELVGIFGPFFRIPRGFRRPGIQVVQRFARISIGKVLGIDFAAEFGRPDYR